MLSAKPRSPALYIASANRRMLCFVRSMRILLIGANGQLGSDLAPVLQRAGHEIIPSTRQTLDIRNDQQVASVLSDVRPDLVINTSAFHNVELCEDQPDEAMLVNGTAVGSLAKLCEKNGCTLLHVSTDFVFDGAKRTPYGETDAPNPLSVYAASKLEGERLVESSLEKHFIV